MYRKDLLALLENNPMTVSDLGRTLRRPPREIAEDLWHLLKTIKRTDYEAVVSPAECRKCGFAFEASKLMKPGKCPNCKSTWIQAPLISFEKKS